MTKGTKPPVALFILWTVPPPYLNFLLVSQLQIPVKWHCLFLLVSVFLMHLATTKKIKVVSLQPLLCSYTMLAIQGSTYEWIWVLDQAETIDKGTGNSVFFSKKRNGDSGMHPPKNRIKGSNHLTPLGLTYCAAVLAHQITDAKLT